MPKSRVIFEKNRGKKCEKGGALDVNLLSLSFSAHNLQYILYRQSLQNKYKSTLCIDYMKPSTIVNNNDVLSVNNRPFPELF